VLLVRLVLLVRPELRERERPELELRQEPVLLALVLLPLPVSALLPFCIQLPQTIMSQRKAGKEKLQIFFSSAFHLLSKIFKRRALKHP